MQKMSILICFLLLSAKMLSQSAVAQAKVFIEAKQYEQSELVLAEYLEKYPTDVIAKELYGDALGYQEKWDETIAVYKRLALDNTPTAEYFYKYGGAMGMKALKVSKFKALGMIKDIKLAFLKAAELDPNHIDVRWALVEFYMQLPGIVGGSERKAQKYADQLMKLSPVDGWLAKGYIAEYDKDVETAEIAYKKAIETGGSELTYSKLIDLYEANGHPQKAVETTKACLAKHDSNRMHYQIGKIAATYNINPELGLSCLSKYIENHTVKDGVPKDWAYYRMAQIYKNIGEKDKAQQWIRKALQSRPSFKEALAFSKQIDQMACC